MNKLLSWIGLEWNRKLSAVLWAIFLYQYVHWLSQQKYNGAFWLEPSIGSAQTSLWIIALVEALFHVRRWIRCLIGLLLIIAAHALFLDYTPVWQPVTSLESFLFLIDINASQLIPYMWFGLGTALVYIIISYHADSKGKILFVVLASIILFSIIDSFSKEFYFWDQVGFMIFSGLLLIVIQHFAQFKEKHPASWQWLKEYPGKVAVPIAILISVVVLSGTLAPNARPFLKDPYTAWKAMRGEKVVSMGKGFGGGLSLNSFIRSAESGYSRNDEVIGGGFNYDYSEVMTVNTTHRSYWRGEIRSHYTGRGWETGDEEQYDVSGPVEPEQPLGTEANGIDASLLETVQVSQTFIMYDNEAYPVLFGAYSPHQLTAVEADGNLFQHVQWFQQQQVLRWDSDDSGDYPKVYQLKSLMPLIDEEGLRQTSTQLPEPFSSVYLQLPATVTDRVKQLAADVTEDADNAYDQMKLLEQFLRTEYAYTNTPDTSKALRHDFVDDFLFEVQEGYCDYYSTAMIVMARSLGVPARWVKGYASGVSELDMNLPDFQDPAMELNPDGAGTYTVRNSDAHSWVEIYFEGYGWIPFEPTANFSLPVYYPQQAMDLTLPDLNNTGTEEVSQGDAAILSSNWFWPGVFAAAGLALIALLLWKRASLMLRIRGFAYRDLEVDEERLRIILEFERFLKYARRKGFIRNENETVRETMKRWSAKGSWLKPNLDQLLILFEKAKYSGIPIQSDEVKQVQQVLERLRVDMK